MISPNLASGCGSDSKIDLWRHLTFSSLTTYLNFWNGWMSSRAPNPCGGLVRHLWLPFAIWWVLSLKAHQIATLQKKCMVAGGLEPVIPQLLAQCSSIVPHWIPDCLAKRCQYVATQPGESADIPSRNHIPMPNLVISCSDLLCPPMWSCWFTSHIMSHGRHSQTTIRHPLES